MRSGIRFIVFDWDGTLMDSEGQIVSCLHAAIAGVHLHAGMDHEPQPSQHFLRSRSSSALSPSRAWQAVQCR